MSFLIGALGVLIAALGFGYKIWEKRHDDLKIIRATYGKNNLTINVSKQLSRRIKKGSLSLQVTNDIPGSDPAPHEVKIIRIKYWYKGSRHNREYIEGEKIDLP